MSKKFLFVFGTLLMVLAACGKKEAAQAPATPAPTAVPAPAAVPTPAAPPAPVSAAVSATTIGLGKAIGADKKISIPAETFAKGDTFYASIDTTGTGTATLKAKWTYHKGTQAALVKEDSQTITPTGPATSEFHVSKPDGWPSGEYQVELFLDDESIGVKRFTVS